MIFDKMAEGYGSFGLGRDGPRVTSGMGVPGVGVGGGARELIRLA